LNDRKLCIGKLQQFPQTTCYDRWKKSDLHTSPSLSLKTVLSVYQIHASECGNIPSELAIIEFEEVASGPKMWLKATDACLERLDLKVPVSVAKSHNTSLATAI
jgi:hypothetical protein